MVSMVDRFARTGIGLSYHKLNVGPKGFVDIPCAGATPAQYLERENGITRVGQPNSRYVTVVTRCLEKLDLSQ